MDKKNKDNPTYPVYTFNGNNTNYQFLHPGKYQVNFATPRGRVIGSEAPSWFPSENGVVSSSPARTNSALQFMQQPKGRGSRPDNSVVPSALPRASSLNELEKLHQPAQPSKRPRYCICSIL